MEVTANSAGRYAQGNVSLTQVRSFLETLDYGVILSDQEGQMLASNRLALAFLQQLGLDGRRPLNILREVLKVDVGDILQRVQGREEDVTLKGSQDGKHYQARLRWIRESEWLAIEFVSDNKKFDKFEEQPRVIEPTVQELLQEREVTYRNLLAAYLKLQEVNRQKTVFLASAAHELKTPLAVIKGYYDLLLTGSLGRLTEKQRDILEESKESCERLVRLVSMFLNYSALESGKLVLQLR
ncbi:MAG: histidine kinase dimerization/phospho-acceptor domain-containing protein, partial [Candidatus Acidiferrum sp.]